MRVLPSRSFSLLVTLVTLWTLMERTDAQQTQSGGASKNPNDINVSGILDALLRGYDKRIRPNYGGPMMDVGITMYILNIYNMNEESGDFTMDFYFRQYWKDSRLGFVAQPGIESLSLGAELAKNIWVPDTFFANEKSAYFHEATTSNSFIRITSNGDITRSIRLTVTATCPMNLQYFPMDRQLCTIEIESYGYSMRDIRYIWNAGEKSIGISNEVMLPQFRVVGHRQKSKEIILSTGNYSRLACEIQFVRSMGYYLIQIYIPSSLIVVISWVSFWLNRNATPARVSLGVTTVLTMTTLMSSTNAALPKISYVKSIDIFLGTCFVMVFASLLEYATVGYLGKRIQMRKTRFQNLQKMAESRKPLIPPSGDANHAENPGGPPMEPPTLNRFPMEHQRNCPYGNGSSDGRKKTPDPKDARHGRLTPLFVEPVAGGAGDAEAGGGGGGGSALPQAPKNINRLCGMSPSDIDKYSRVVFPVCFICFNLMYWIIYLYISDEMTEDLIPLSPS